jgi:hypothetical protein
LALIGFNIYVIFNYGNVRDQVKQLSDVAIGLTTRIISDAIPKYKEESQ